MPISARSRSSNFAKWCDVANKIGAKQIRVFSGPVPKGYERRWNEAASWMVDSLRKIAEIAKANGVKACVQNHGDMLATSDQVIEVLRRVDYPDGLGANDDTGYFMDKNPDGTPAWYEAIERILPYSINMQVKTCLVKVKDHRPLPQERTDVKKLMTIIRAAPFRGYVPIETLEELNTPYDPFAVLPDFLGKVRQALEDTAAGPR